MNLILKLCEIQGITFSVGHKEKILKIHDFLALTHALSNRVSEKAFLEENENKMIQHLYLEICKIREM